jgi:hypothetical protein
VVVRMRAYQAAVRPQVRHNRCWFLQARLGDVLLPRHGIGECCCWGSSNSSSCSQQLQRLVRKRTNRLLQNLCRPSVTKEAAGSIARLADDFGREHCRGGKVVGGVGACRERRKHLQVQTSKSIEWINRARQEGYWQVRSPIDSTWN